MSGIKNVERQLAKSAQHYNAYISRVPKAQCLSAVNAALSSKPTGVSNVGSIQLHFNGRSLTT